MTKRSWLRPKKRSTLRDFTKGWAVWLLYWYSCLSLYVTFSGVCREKPLPMLVPKLILWTYIFQIMLVKGYEGQKVQDVKKPIQKMMVEKVKQKPRHVTALNTVVVFTIFLLVWLNNVVICNRVKPWSTWSQKNRSCHVRPTSVWWLFVTSGECLLSRARCHFFVHFDCFNLNLSGIWTMATQSGSSKPMKPSSLWKRMTLTFNTMFLN